jgi:parallel beta-helix repeat protein/autotransporter-associated beta strand protein
MKPRTALGARVLAVRLLFLFAGATATRADVVISQVYEGQESDRYVEVSNTGNAPVNLSAYKLAIWRKSKSSGDASIDGITPSYAVLSGTLAAGATILLKNADANDPSYAANSGVANASADFDGNDAIAIVNAGNVIVDLFGVGINNRGQNFSRKPTAPSASALFNAANWTSSSYSVANGASPGTGNYLGFYSFTVVVQPVLTLSPVAVAGLNATLGAASASQAYAVAGSNLTTPVGIAVSDAAIEISTNSATGFTNAITVGAVGGSVSQTLHVRISAAAPLGVVSATVNHVSGTVSATLPVGGEVAAASASKAGPRLALDYSVPANDFIGQPVGEVLTELNDTSGSVSVVQSLIDAARAANPDAFIRVRLKPNTVYTITGVPLVLGSKVCLSGAGTTLAANAATVAGSLVRITPESSLVSVDRLTLDGAGKNLHGIEAHGVSRVNIDRVTVQDTGADGISLQGAGASVFDNEMTVVRCTVYGVTGAAGIRVRDATQCIVMDNDCHNNATGIHLEASEHAAVVNNRLRYNSVAGVRLREAKNNRVASNLCEGNPTGILTEGVASSYGYNFIFRNSISSAVTGIVLGQSRDALYGNEFPSGVSAPLGFAAGAVNRVVQTGPAVPAVNQEYFHPPTASAWHSGPVKNGQLRTDVPLAATTLSAVQAAYDAARAANRGSVIVLRLTSPVIDGDSPLTLQSDTCVVIDGTIILAPGVTAFVATGTADNQLGFISISGGAIDGQNTTGRSGMVFTNCGKVLVEDVNLLNFGSKTTRVANSDVILFAGCREPVIVDSCVLNGGAARGIWTKGITGSSLSGMLFIDNVVSEVNMDGIDFDTATSSSSAFYNLCRNNVRYGIFVEEGAKHVQAVGNTCTGNDIGINVYSFDVGPTERNTFVANTLSANRRGLRFGGADTTPSTGLLTRNNFSFNNRIRNSEPLSAIDAQDDGSQNYVSQNVLSANAADYGSTSTATFFNSPASPSSGADGAAYANVDFTAYTDGVLVGQDGWLTYGSNNTVPVAVSGGEARLAGGSKYQAAYKTIAPYQFADNSSVHLRADVNVQSAPANGTDFFLVTRETDAVSGQPTGKSYFRLYVKSSGSGFQLGWNPHAETGTNGVSPVPTYADTVFSFNRDYRVVLRCDSVPSRNNDDTYLFVDPADSSAIPLLSRSTWLGNSFDEFSATLSTGSNRVGGSLNLVLKQQDATSTPLLSLGVKNIVVGDTLGDIGIVEVTESLPEPVATEFTNSAVAGAVTWTSGPGWSATPLSSSNAAIRFQGALGGNLTITQDTGANFVLNTLTNANTGAFAMNFTGGAFEFRKKDSVNPVLIFVNSSSTVQRFSNNFVLNNTLTVSQAGSTTSNSIIAGPISGAGGLRKGGNGHVYIMSGSNSFGGGVTSSAGILIVSTIGSAGANSSLGTNSVITMGDGSGTNALRTINPAAEISDKTFFLGGSSVNTRLENYSGGVLTLNGSVDAVTNAGKTLYILARSNNVVLGGSIATNAAGSNNLSLFLTNSTNRTLTLSASNAFRGGVTIESGTLELAHPSALGTGDVRLTPTVPDGAVLRVAYAGPSATLGNLMLQNDAIIDAGSDSSSALRFATATNWAADKFLTVSNSMSGKIYITNTNGVALSRIRAAGFPTYTASLGAEGLLVFSPPPPAGSAYDEWLASAGAVHGPAALLDYAFGASVPGTLAPPYGPSVSGREGLLILTYYVRSDAVGLAVTPELSVDLAGINGGFGPDARITGVSLGTVTTTDGVVLDRREARLTMSDVAPKAFLRLRVTQQQ